MKLLHIVSAYLLLTPIVTTKATFFRNFSGYKINETFNSVHLIRSTSVKKKFDCLAECNRLNDCDGISLSHTKSYCYLYKDLAQDYSFYLALDPNSIALIVKATSNGLTEANSVTTPTMESMITTTSMESTITTPTIESMITTTSMESTITTPTIESMITTTSMESTVTTPTMESMITTTSMESTITTPSIESFIISQSTIITQIISATISRLYTGSSILSSFETENSDITSGIEES